RRALESGTETYARGTALGSPSPLCPFKVKNRGAYVNKIISVRRIVYDNKWHSTTNAFQRI
ncbi:MAG: hypothetical protein ACLUQB_08625, partial [Lachnospiraceae bacterium]